ncbi:hypothetical protein V8F20_011756 [Naviculisporaceae sp. PSN 640]
MASTALASRRIQLYILWSFLVRLTASSLWEPSTTWEPSATSLDVVQPTPTALAEEDVVIQCDFEDLQQLVHHVIGVNRTSYNISRLVDTCPDVCDLVYGTGNPDISGIGAVISYTFQGVTSLIFGPLLAVLALYLGSDISADSWFTYDPEKVFVAKFFVPVARSIHQANIYTAVSVLVATVARIHGDFLPLGESKFLSSLTLFEFLTCWVCTLSFFPLHTSSKLEKRALAIYILATFSLWLVASYSDSGLSGSVLEAITSTCIDNRDSQGSQEVGGVILQIATPLASNSSATSESLTGVGSPENPKTTEGRTLGPASELGFFILFCVGIFVFRCAIDQIDLVCTLLAPFARPLWRLIRPSLMFFVDAGKLSFRLAAGLLRVGPQRMGSLIITLSLGSAAAVSTWWLLADLFKQRERLSAFAGNKYQDNDWGFGQITAAMTWAPMVQETLFAIIREYRTAPYQSQYRHSRNLLRCLERSGHCPQRCMLSWTDIDS